MRTVTVRTTTEDFTFSYPHEIDIDNINDRLKLTRYIKKHFYRNVDVVNGYILNIVDIMVED
jgi:hypothetical protein